ncbi:MAG: hypothetical protein ACM3TR_21095 [Caulobacteraceae bacterium]
MLELKFYIAGGYIKMEKKAFLQEMLGKDSCLRQILNCKDSRDFSEGHPNISEADENGMVTIDFNFNVHIELGQSYSELLGKLKSRYRDKMKGKVCCRLMAGYSMSNFTIDLDSNDDMLQYAFN